MSQIACPHCDTTVDSLAQSCKACGSHFTHGVHPFILFISGMGAAFVAAYIMHWSVVPGLVAFGAVFYGLYLATKNRVKIRQRR
jgi:hypothetical protein